MWQRLKSPASRLFTQAFIQAQIKENIKAPHHWPLWREFTGDRWILAQRASYAEKVSIWEHHNDTALVDLLSFQGTQELRDLPLPEEHVLHADEMILKAADEAEKQYQLAVSFYFLAIIIISILFEYLLYERIISLYYALIIIIF